MLGYELFVNVLNMNCECYFVNAAIKPHWP